MLKGYKGGPVGYSEGTCEYSRCGYPGQSGGASIADVVFGAVNPSAKLSMTWYTEELTKQVGPAPYCARVQPGPQYCPSTRTR